MHTYGLLALLAFVVLSGASSTERAPPGTSSLTFVFDTTGSMNDDLIQVQDGARKILDTVLTQREKLIYNYVYVPFHDPRVGPVYATTDSTAFQRHLNSVHVVGGGDCPEMTLSGIQLALETALPSSFIYVFTDARSKDYHLEDQILNLIQEKQSSVVFVMTGDCNDRAHPGFRTYEKIAAASFGQVFHLEKTDVNKVLNYVRHSVAARKVHVMYEVRDRGGTNLRLIPVDQHLTELTLSLSGDKDDGDFLDISLVDPKGKKVERTEFSKESGTIDLNNIKLIRIKQPMPGIWRVRTSSRLKHTLRVLGHGAIDFKYGFSARPVERIELTHQRPISHQSTYLLVNMTGLNPPGTVVEIALVDYYGKEIVSKPASIHQRNPFMYYIGPIVPPKGMFFVRVNGEDDKSYEFQRIAPTAISTVQAGGPRAYMADRTAALAGHSVNLTCSVASRSEYTLYWYKGTELLGGPLFYPYSDTAFWTLNEVTPQDRGEYKCVVVSDNGNHTASTFLETREPPPEITNIRNESSPVGMPTYLHCRTQSNRPTFQWSRANKVFGNTDNTRLYTNGTLMIVSTSRQDAGEYRCRVQTAGGTTEATLYLKVMELPRASIYPPSLFFVRGQSFNISCYATGDPKPEPQWYFKGNLIKPDHYKYYITYKYDLIVHRPMDSDAGVYECRASNMAGYHVDSAVVQMAIPPKVKVSRNRQMVGRGDRVVLDCQIVVGTPKPKVIWYRGGREVPSYRYIQIDGSRLTIQGVQDSDAGSYTCVAQNVAGRDFGSMNLDVGSLPTIVPTPDIVRVNIERSVTLQCRAIGHPVPKISWQRHGLSINKMAPRVKILPDGSLLINNAQIEDQDRYTCTAKNTFGQQDKTTMLMVTGLVSPVLGHVPPQEQLIEGKDLRLSCVVVLGTPKPTLQWFKDGIPLQTSGSVILQGGGSGLLLRNGHPKHEGRYTCAAVSPAGNSTLNINVQLIRRPVIEYKGVRDFVVSLGEPADIPCKVTGKPTPKASWTLDGKQLPATGPEYTVLPDNTLHIHRANSNHIGRFTCTVTNAAGTSEQEFGLTVLSAPQIAPGQISYNLIQGDALTLPCDVKGEPMPTITWYLNDEIFTEGVINQDGSLTIPDADEAHRGHLKCVAENEVGVDERIIVLTVHTAPTIEGSGQVRSVVVNVNETVVLPCPARAQPPPSRAWSYEGDRLYPGYTHGSVIRFGNDGSIEIATPQMNHAGKYTCHVSNLAGDDHITYLLKVQEPPLIISDLPGTVDVVLGMLLEIPCRAVATPDPTVTWEKDGFQIIPDDGVHIDAVGTLRIARTQSTHRGEYRCIARNPAGKDQRDILVVVQESPTILPTTLSDYTTVEGDRIELRCLAKANPPPVITWSRQGISITSQTPGMHVTDDGTLVIDNVVNEDGGHYTCKASNAAGDIDKVIRLVVITPPDIPDQETIISEAVVAGQPFSLYCPVFSNPLPQISWHLDDRPIAEGDTNVHLSDDKRRLHILRSRTADSGSYKCVARNPAGESSKTFHVEVLVAPTLDESTHKLKVSVLENTAIEMGCPVSGIPSPDISWLANGQLVEEGGEKRGVSLASGGESILIESAQLYHEGIYTCVATNKAGTLDIDVHLTVLAPPRVGDDEELEVLVGKGITLNCDVEQEGLQSTITWLVNGSESLPLNAQVLLNGRRLFIRGTAVDNHAEYQCRVRNNAGESSKHFKLNVIAPPQFRDKEYTDSVQVTTGTALTLMCYVKGSPKPQVRWLRDGRVIPEDIAVLSDDAQKLIVQHSVNANHRYACLAANKAGTASREIAVEVIAPPEINDSGERTIIEVHEGHSVTLECPVSAPIGLVDISWLQRGRLLTSDDVNMQISLDKTRLMLMNVEKDDEATYTCLAKNSAGQAAREFQLNVLVRPKMVGKMVEDVVVVEGESLELECDFDADPIPQIMWSKDGGVVDDRVQLLNEKRSALVSSAGEQDAGNYRCTVQNKAGRAEKTFNVRVILKPVGIRCPRAAITMEFLFRLRINIPPCQKLPKLISSNETTAVEMLVTHPVTFECPIVSPIGVELMWTKDSLPIVAGVENVQILNGGRHLLITSVSTKEEAVYTCVARNQAGTARKNFKLSVLVPPSIIARGGAHQVIENNTLVLPCEVEGSPSPRIVWTKDGESALGLPLVQSLSGGQQFKIVNANERHRGSYMCTAVNKVGKAEINFDVDVITRPSVARGVKEVVEVIRNESAVFRCPIKERRFVGEITWLKDFEPINVRSHKYSLSHSNRKLHVLHSELHDEGSYSCRVKNAAGESRVDYKLMVLVPPEIIMLDKEKNRTAVENTSVLLNCPATGKPEPVIYWYKDGELLTPRNVTKRVRSGVLEGNDLRIARIQVTDGGRFTCEAKNKAGMTEQDVLMYVMTPPRIEREGVPSEIGGKSRSTVTISCPAYGRPHPTVTWLKAGRALDYSPEVYLSANGMKLHFLDLNKVHADRYTCIASNLAGEDKRDFTIKLLESPTIEGPNILRKVTVNAGRTSIINCPVMGSPEPSIAWLRNGQTLVPSPRHVFLNGGRQLQISETIVQDDARYTCIATNNIGLADLETYLQVIGGPLIAGDKSESVEVIVNEPHDLDCTVTGTEPMDIEWQRGGQTIDFGGIRGGSSYMQISARGRRLHILSAQVGDTGRFTCVAKNSAGEARKSYDLRVLVPPMINETTSSLPLQTIIPGTAFAVECKVDAIPDAEVTWTLNGRRVLSDEAVVLLNNNQTLWVNRANDFFGGRYTCTAVNKVANATRDFLVKLTAPPMLDRGSQELDVVAGDFIVLTCKVVSGTGNLAVKWLVDGKPVKNGPISPTVTVNERRIEIRNARLSDSGNYVCIVENEAGQARKKFELAVLERPRFLDMTNLSPSIIVGRPLVLDCSVTGTPKPTVVWLKNGKAMNNTDVLFLNDRQQLHIESATEGDAGRYSCVAENKPGRVEKDLIVAVLKTPNMEDFQRAFEVAENDTHTLNCPISDPSVGIQWLKNGVPVTTSHNLQLSTSGHKLHIMRGQVSDGGKYTCRAWNDAGEDTSSMDVIVLVPPKIGGPAFRTIDAILNQTVQLECRVSGTPPPEIVWSSDGKTIFPSEQKQILSNGTVLRLFGLQGNQEGRYSCTAINKVGKAEADTFLQVTAPPRIITPSDELKVIAGQGQTIRCEVSGTPPPKVEWLKNGKKFDNAMTQTSTNLHYIHLREAEVEDAGRYTCIASNRAGEHRMSTELHVLVPPHILEGERVVQVKENTTLTLECQATGNPAPQIVWKREGVPVESVQGPRMVIISPIASDAGRFTCEARNEAGTASADFEVDVFIKPRFRDLKSEIRVKNGERTRLECKADGHPAPTITWLRGGRPIDDMKNFILSPRGETLMILKAKRADAGSYSCVAKNLAGESMAGFTVTVLTRPHIDEHVDQNPRVVQGNDMILHCPVRGNPTPVIHWLYNGELARGNHLSIVNGRDLKIANVKERDAGRYTCLAENEAGSLSTDYEAEVMGPPRFHRDGDTVYETRVGDAITMDCAVDADPKPEIIWYRGDAPLYLSDNIHISPDGQQITIRGTEVTDGGKYTCRAKNEAGSADIDLTLKVLVPPSIDKSNIIGNPLAIVGRSIYLECPVTGIPQPTVEWHKEGSPIDISDERLLLDQNNQTFGILHVEIGDQGRYDCTAENKGGKSSQEFLLEVLVPPQMETLDTQKFTRREQDSLTLWCPVRRSPDSTAATEIFWYKDGRPVDSQGTQNVKISSEGRRLQLLRTTLGDAGNYSCIALNRAGESSLDFDVEILSAPKVDGSRNDVHPHVAVGRPLTLWCVASGHPFPTIRWLKDGKLESGNQDEAVRVLENGQALEIIDARPDHAGVWTCEVENDAGKTELGFNLDVWTSPVVRIESDETIKATDSSITLHCQADGNPQPSLSWSMGGQPLISSAEGARISLKGTRLDIPRLQQSHVGEYVCTARNEAGTDEASVHVDVLVPPVIARDNIEMSPRLPTGQTLTLLCDATGKPYPQIEWHINRTRIRKTSGNVILGQDGRYIQINNISLMDHGSYHCVAKNVAGRDELLYTVAVVQAPLISNGGTQQVIEGEVAKLNCGAYGEPPPVVTWQRNGVRVETGVRYIAEDTVLTVIETRSSDSGIYVCVATNEAGTSQQAFTLEVLVSPRIVTMSPNESVVPVNDPFSLKCGVRGYPFPEIVWTIDEQPVEEAFDGGFSIAEDGTLFIEKAKERAVHHFKCTARNDAGIDEKEYVVKTISPPFVSKEGLKTINATEGDPSLLLCEIEGHAPQIYWYKDRTPLTLSSNMELNEDRSQLKIYASKLHDEGLYSCVAMNTAGNATQKQQLYVGVPPRITEKPRRIIVKSGQPAELWCEAVGIPKPQITWLKDDVALPQTAVDEQSETPKSTAIFANVSSADAGVYTCKANNWAGTSYKDVDLVVLIPPEIYPEMLNLTTNLDESIVIPCNASGIPEPVVSWVKMPNIDIVGREDKYHMLGSSLVIRQIDPEDDGFYHCIAKSNAGQAIGARRINVNVPKKDYKVIWVECDDMGNPVKTTYVPARGDVPESEANLLPWKQDYQDLPMNGTNGILIRCLPGGREPRRVPIATAPHFTYAPRTQIVHIGSLIDLHCSAYGPPMPEILWMKDGDVLSTEQSVDGHSTLQVNASDAQAAGTYVCVAQNVVGTSRTQAKIMVDRSAPHPTQSQSEHRLAVLTCLEEGIPQTESVSWTIDGDPVNKEDELLHVMNNGSLVILDVEGVAPSELHSYQCHVRNLAQQSAVRLVDVAEDVPKVMVHQNKIYTQPGDDVLVDCRVQSNPLTTKVQWTKNNIPLVIDDRISIMANNALHIKELRLSDRASYKCRGSNQQGKSWDGLDIIVQDGPSAVVGFIDGNINHTPLTNQALFMNVTPEVNDNSVYIKIDNLVDAYDPVTNAMLGYMSASCPDLAYDPGRRSKHTKTGKFKRLTDYSFDTGETMHVKQHARGLEGSYLQMDVLFDGDLPQAKHHDSILLDDTEEELVEESPGLIRGYGHSALRLGKHTRIPFHWNNSISYDASKGMSIGPGKTMKLKVKSGQLIGDRGYKMAAKARRKSKCPQGFEKINGFCEDIDECAMDPTICGEEAQCVNSVGGFSCERDCTAGFKTRWDGSCKDIDECTLGIHNCTRGALCTNTPGGFTCETKCLDGYFMNRNGECEDIDECASSPCAEPLKCLNQLGSYVCLCPSGFSADDDQHCQDMPTENDSPAKVLRFDAKKEHGCPVGYTWNGLICEDIDECAFESPCQFECHNTPGSYECECPEGYELDDGECIDLDECADEPCTDDELCFNKLGSFECIDNPCPLGYHLDVSQCLANCANCSLAPIRIHLLSVPSGLESSTSLLRLTAYDSQSRVLRRTRFHLTTSNKFFRRAPFALKNEGGRAVLQNLKALVPNLNHRLSIRSVSKSPFNARKYHSDFIVFISVADHPF